MTRFLTMLIVVVLLMPIGALSEERTGLSNGSTFWRGGGDGFYKGGVGEQEVNDPKFCPACRLGVLKTLVHRPR